MHPVTGKEGPMALVMGLGFIAFGLTMILRPARVRENFDRFADYWKEGSWHPYKLPDWGLRVVGAAVIALSAIFFQIAYMDFTR